MYVGMAALILKSKLDLQKVLKEVKKLCFQISYFDIGWDCGINPQVKIKTVKNVQRGTKVLLSDFIFLTWVGMAASILKSKLELQKVLEGVVVSDFKFDGGWGIGIHPQSQYLNHEKCWRE